MSVYCTNDDLRIDARGNLNQELSFVIYLYVSVKMTMSLTSEHWLCDKFWCDELTVLIRILKDKTSVVMTKDILWSESKVGD